MLALYRKYAATTDAWTICRWHEGHGGASTTFLDQQAAARWLCELGREALRRMAFDYLDHPALQRLTDASIAEQLAAMIVGRELRVVPTSPLHRDVAHEMTTEEKLVRQLRVTAHAFVFEGRRFRIVDALTWASLRGSDDERYQVLPHDEAQAMLTKMVQWPALSADESAAIARAVPLVPQVWRPAQAKGGVLLLRIVETVVNLESARDEGAVTPSQLAGRQKEVETHWIQIELIDLEDQPVPDQAYKIELPGGEIREGRLDANGTAYIGGLTVAGQCKVCFPEIDTKEWRAA